MEVKKHQNEIAFLLEKISEYKTHLGVSALLAVMLGGGFYFYKSYRDGIESAAHRDFVEYLEYYNARVGKDESAYGQVESFDSASAKWNKVAEVFGTGYKNHSGSGLGPIFLTYQSEAYYNLGDMDKAIDLLSKSLESNFSPSLKQLYLVKLALMKIDTGDSSGVEVLKALSDDTNFSSAISSLGYSLSGSRNYVHDLALFRLGEYYWFNQDYDLAKNYWNILALRYGQNTKTPSTWARHAQEKLSLIENR